MDAEPTHLKKRVYEGEQIFEDWSNWVDALADLSLLGHFVSFVKHNSSWKINWRGEKNALVKVDPEKNAVILLPCLKCINFFAVFGFY